MEDHARGAGLSTIVERKFLSVVYWIPGMDDGQMLTFNLKAVKSFGAGYRSGGGRGGGIEVKDPA